MKTDHEKYDLPILQLIAQDTPQGWALLMRRHYDALYNYGGRFTSDEDVIKDAIQEVLINLWERRATVGSIRSLRYYLVAAVKNKIISALRRSMRHEDLDTAAQENQYGFHIEFSTEKIVLNGQVPLAEATGIRDMLDRLSPRQKEVIYLKYYQQLTHSQIAQLLGISPQSLYNLLHESLRKLRSLLKKEPRPAALLKSLSLPLLLLFFGR